MAAPAPGQRIIINLPAEIDDIREVRHENERLQLSLSFREKFNKNLNDLELVHYQNTSIYNSSYNSYLFRDTKGNEYHYIGQTKKWYHQPKWKKYLFYFIECFICGGCFKKKLFV